MRIQLRQKSFIIAGTALLLLLGFQNCQKYKFSSVDEGTYSDINKAFDANGNPIIGGAPGAGTPGASTPGAGSGEAGGNFNILVLDPTRAGSLNLSGEAALKTSGTITVNSNGSSAANLSGSALIQAAQFNVAGDYQLSGSAKITAAIKAGAAAAADPYANLAEPSSAGLATLDGNKQGSIITLQPGIYNRISVSAGTSVVLAPGIYILKDGLNVSGSAKISGSGVLLYLAGGSLNLSGSSAITLSPAASGAYAGITIFQARTNSSAASISGSTVGTIRGAVYLPAASLELSGGSNIPQPFSIIAYDLNLSGGSFILGEK